MMLVVIVNVVRVVLIVRLHGGLDPERFEARACWWCLALSSPAATALSPTPGKG
jgi:hypothetical protein